MRDENIEVMINELNENQKKAAISPSKRILILAGAGSGKTKVLTSRIAFLLSKGVRAKSILALTFTNKASSEMRDRIALILSNNKRLSIDESWMGTFHSMFNKILRSELDNNNYDIIDTDDQKKLIKKVLNENALLDIKVQTVNKIIEFISKAKNEGKTPLQSKSLENGFPEIPNASGIYQMYEDKKDDLNLLDFDDLIFKTVSLFEENNEILEKYQNQFKHILVDEYQDTNMLQDKLLNMLLNEKNENFLFVVGDEDQSIYGWRGAEVENILKFKTRHKNAEVIKLEQNYRSTKNILSAANNVIKNNQLRYGKKLYSDNKTGEKIDVYSAASQQNEAEYCISKINEYKKNGFSYSDIAILYRSNFISREFEKHLSERMIPYLIIGGVGFWSRSEIKDVLSFLIVANNKMNEIQVERGLTLLGGVGGKTVQKIRDCSNINDISMFDAIKKCVEDKDIKGKVATSLEKYFDKISSYIEMKTKPKDIVRDVIDSFNINDFYIKKDGEEKGEERIQNINEMVTFIDGFDFNEEGISAFLEMIQLQQNLKKDNEGGDSVKLMTMHGSKGLEFPIVFIAGVEDTIFPSEKSMISKSKIEEERRLMYVAITRAEHHLNISYASNRFGGKPTGESIFIREIPSSLKKT